MWSPDGPPSLILQQRPEGRRPHTHSPEPCASGRSVMRPPAEQLPSCWGDSETDKPEVLPGGGDTSCGGARSTTVSPSSLSPLLLPSLHVPTMTFLLLGRIVGLLVHRIVHTSQNTAVTPQNSSDPLLGAFSGEKCVWALSACS